MLPIKCFSLLPLYVSKEASVMRLIYFNVLLLHVKKRQASVMFLIYFNVLLLHVKKDRLLLCFPVSVLACFRYT
jgi:hypothetical protein